MESAILAVGILTLLAAVLVPLGIHFSVQNKRIPKPILGIDFKLIENNKYRISLFLKNIRKNHLEHVLTAVKYPEVINIDWDRENYKIGSIEKTGHGSTVTVTTDVHIGLAPTVVARGNMEVFINRKIPIIVQVQADFMSVEKIYGYIDWEGDSPKYVLSTQHDLMSRKILYQIDE